MSTPTSNIFRNSKQLTSDLNAYARFPTAGPIANLAAATVAMILKGVDKEGNPCQYGTRERLAAAKLVVAMERVNQIEMRDMTTFMGILQLAKEAIENGGRQTIDLPGANGDGQAINWDRLLEPPVEDDPIEERIARERGGAASGNGNGKP
jgi:hypothetical protein